MKTPDEARKTWCDNARAEHPEGGSFNRTSSGTPAVECFCIADKCSKWTWIDDEPEDIRVKGGGTERATKATTGFCGLNVAMAMKVFGP